MSMLFNHLPGFSRSQPGLEVRVMRLLPRALVLGSGLLMLPPVLARLLGLTTAEVGVAMVDLVSVSLLMLHWTALFTTAIAAFIVHVMKGPAYVADAYPLPDADLPTSH